MIVKQQRLRKKIHKRLRRTTYREVTESAVSAEVVIFLLRGVQNFGEKQGMNTNALSIEVKHKLIHIHANLRFFLVTAVRYGTVNVCVFIF